MDRERAKDVVLFVYGSLDRLKKEKMITGGSYEISDEGRERFLELEKSGFTPTEKEITSIMDFILKTNGGNNHV